MFPYASHLFVDLSTEVEEGLLFVLTFLSFARGISYFRLHFNTRYLVNMIFKVLRDMRAFFVILVYATVAFSLVEFAISSEIEKDENYMYFTDNWLVVIGDLKRTPDSIIGWIIFITFSVISTVMLLNLIISVIGDTYDRVQSELSVVDV